MLHRLITLTVWALVGWSLLYLGLRLLPQPLQAPAGTQALAAEAPAPAQLARLFGAAPQAAPEALPPGLESRFRLLGLVAPKAAALQDERGVALIAVDGGPPRSYRVGDAVDGELRLLSVSSQGASLGQAGQAPLQLSLPPPPPVAGGFGLPPVPGAPVPPPPGATAVPGAPSGMPTPLPELPLTNRAERDMDQAGPRRPPPQADR